MTYKYESPAQYRKTQSSIDKLNLEKVQLQEQLEKSEQDQGLLQRGLELAGRPLAATSSAIAAATRPGGDVGQAFMQGLTGVSPIRSMADVLQQLGVPEMGALETPLGRFTGRGTLGFGADILADPLSLATLPLAGGPSLLGRAARAPSMLRRAAPVAPQVAQAAVGPVPGIAETTARMYEPSAARAIGQKLSQIPGVGPIIERVAGPAALARTALDKTLMGFERTRSMKDNIVNVASAPLRAMRQPFKVQDRPQGQLVFIESLGQWVPDNDLPTFIQALNPAQRAWLETASQMRKPLLAQAQQVGVQFEKGLAPEALDDVFVSRRVIGRIGQDPMGRSIRVPIAGRKAVQLARKYKSQAEGMDAGLIYADLVTSQQMAMRELVEAIAVKQLTDDLVRQGIAVAKGKGLKGIAPKELAGIPGSAGFEGLRFTPLDRDEIVRHFVARQPVTGALRPVATATNVIRTLGTTYDFSGQFIQNLIMMVNHPVEWGKIWVQSFKVLQDPAAHQAFLAKHAWLYKEVPDLVIGGSEYMAGAQRLQRLPGMTRFPAVFDAQGDMARTYWILANRHLYLKDPSLKEAIVSFANKATGTLSIQGLGIFPSQQMIEGTFLLFAPRYTRAALALAGDVFQGGLRGDLAREALANMLVAGMSFYNRVAILTGLDDEEIQRRLDPANPNFLSLDAGPMKVGIGGIWVGLAKMLGRISSDPSQAAAWDMSNPVIRFISGRAAPGTSLARDLLVQKETYVGQPLAGLSDIAPYLGTRLLPFAISNVIMNWTHAPPSGTELAAELATGFLGAQARPPTRQDMMEQIAREKFGQSYQSLDPIKQGQVQGDPRIQQIPIPRGMQFEQTRTEAEIWKQYSEPLEEEAQRVLAKQSTPSAFRVLEAQLSDERNARLSMQPEGKKYPVIPMEKKRQKYFEFFRTRPPDYEGAETYLSSLTPTERDYINAKQQGAYARLGGEAAGLMTELFNARQKLQAYWNTQEKALRAKGLWTRWVAANPVQKDKIAQSDAYKEAQRVWGKARENMRKSNPALDRLLVKWYSYTPIR